MVDVSLRVRKPTHGNVEKEIAPGQGARQREDSVPRRTGRGVELPGRQQQHDDVVAHEDRQRLDDGKQKSSVKHSNSRLVRLHELMDTKLKKRLSCKLELLLD
jgi:hypothetical protein